jgi:Tol biopolymer transport system component
VYGNRVVLTDRETRKTTVVSPLVDPDGGDVGAPVISGDGNFVAYSQNDAGSATDVKLWERATGTTTAASVNTAGKAGTGVSLDPHISRTGQYVAFWSSARDLVADAPTAPMSVYRFDRQTGRNVLAMTPPDDAFYGSERCDISDDGRFVATETKSATLVPGDTNGQFDVFRTEVA